MMQILEKIVNAQRAEVQKKKSEMPVPALEKSRYFPLAPRSLSSAVMEGSGVIAEFKKRSPSLGTINATALPQVVCRDYFEAGASAVSVLTNRQFFGGSNDDLLMVRETCDGVILRKEFIIDEYQVVESKSMGADAILLIAGILTGPRMASLSRLASSLGMEVLFEIHAPAETDKLPGEARIIGINSRNLDNFTVDTDLPARIIGSLPPQCIKIAESGIQSPQKLVELGKDGFDGFLIGELFMKEPDPGARCRQFIRDADRLRAGDNVDNPETERYQDH
jgi:indole-3-glycerol phosphate synthase